MKKIVLSLKMIFYITIWMVSAVVAGCAIKIFVSEPSIFVFVHIVIYYYAMLSSIEKMSSTISGFVVENMKDMKK